MKGETDEGDRDCAWRRTWCRGEGRTPRRVASRQILSLHSVHVILELAFVNSPYFIPFYHLHPSSLLGILGAQSVLSGSFSARR